MSSLGVDTYIRDPITDFCITLETYPEVGRTIAQIERPTLFVMEGTLRSARLAVVMATERLLKKVATCRRLLYGRHRRVCAQRAGWVPGGGS